MNFEKVSVIGLGYIGLPTAAVFASHGLTVVGIDVNEKAVNTINEGKIHIVEPDLDSAVFNAVKKGTLKASLTPEPADAFIFAVPTPFKGGNHQPDLSYIQSASEAIAPVLEKGNLVILESTSPVGATEQMAEWLAKARPDLTFPQSHGEDSDIRIAHCPERVLPGHVMRELIENDRVVGGMTPKCSQFSVALYKTFVKGECVVTNARTAEMAKLTENSFRDVNIAFANELSIICDELSIDVWELIALANRHPRVNILQPGPGVGGHCIAVDPWFIVSKTPERARLIRTAREVNDSKPDWVIEKVKIAMTDFLQANPDKNIKDVVIACYGISFKPDIDDLRESPALNICEKVSEAHSGRVLIVEPNITDLPSSLEKCELVDYSVAQSTANIHLLLVDHREFKSSEQPHEGLAIDTKGIWGKE
ncbi:MULTISPECIES: UDP-N-acetyl-D-mannosamine dehydrogenase [Gammaproteobacteria]|uniref:UDP-N-acetyl-D-mannosamine dehydrogenase n=1 Tax=Gammaproteobacteria TaxID=1236 RepID=UPI000DCFF306|nr:MULTISPECIES: UDP-N-acetyl-D-mannosamine dehydrogenase [Gammaproteobacteria]RTE86072.1 UDP-N-acetyl-D-mannosamine dehydrogenase [Aliidiomarina sp. B3213]TCZ91426.1 UDP-N-acetyl-D-mannosamine dehydrogenase [Lysobacter sp. N42]